MKRKFKNFLNRRIITCALSATIICNTFAPIAASAANDAESSPSSSSSSQYIEKDGHRYEIFDTPMYWKDAEAYCESLGGHLVTVVDDDEKNFVEKFAKENGNKVIYWYGATDEDKEGDWKWVTGEDPSIIKRYGRFDNMGGAENYLALTGLPNAYWNDWGEKGNDGNPIGMYSFGNLGFICEWDDLDVTYDSYVASPYVLFSGSNSSDFTLNCWKSTFNGDVYSGRNFVSNASELYLNGKANAVDSVTAYGWKVEIEERNEKFDSEKMPDWDSQIISMAGDYESSSQDIVKIENRNVIDGALRTSGKVTVSGTTFDGNCYIIADGDIIYNVNDFISSGRVVLYSRSGNIIVNGTNIDINGILYAPNGTVSFNSNITNINGRVFADVINFSGSIFNVTGSVSDWELLGSKATIVKTYTFNEDFNEGEFEGVGLDIADELTLGQRNEIINASDEREYRDINSSNGIAVGINSNKSVLSMPEDSVNIEVILKGFGIQEIEENNVDLAIVVDTSGSMSSARRNNAVSAAKEVVSKMKPNDRCAIIKFTTSAAVLQEFTNDHDLLNAAIDKLNANGGTNIATGINKAVSLFSELENNSRQKYIILMSDGEDSSASAQASLNAYNQGITICALSIGNDSRQMKTIADNTKGYYKNSPTADQIGEMMNMFADVVFNNAGTDITFTATIDKNVSINAERVSPIPTNIIENENGSKTLKWTFDKIAIDQSESISFPLMVSDINSGLRNIMSDVSCTYYNRAGNSNTVYGDDVILPAHTYNDSGLWTTVYDSEVSGVEWKQINWNGKLYDDGIISVMAQSSDNLDEFGDWVEITNHDDINGLKGRYIRVKVNMEVSTSGKTPELYDITLLSDGADKTNYINNAPIVSVTGKTITSVSKKITLVSSVEDDTFSSQLSFRWGCENANVQIFNTDKPFASFKFNEAGKYDITLSVSDNSSTSVITKTVTIFDDEILVKPIIDIEVPSIVKNGTEIIGKIVNLNDAEISEYEVLVGGSAVTVAPDGQFSFNAPDSDTIIAVEAKAFNIVGISGYADKAVTVDGNAPVAELKTDSEIVTLNKALTVTAIFDDENGINDYSISLNGESITLDSNYQFSFIPSSVGAYTFELIVEDVVGHITSAEITINAIEDKSKPVVNYSIPRVIVLGDGGEFVFTSDNDTEISVNVNGEAISLNTDGKFTYTPNAVGDLFIDVHASNGENTSTDFTLTVPVVKVELVSNKAVYTDTELVEVKFEHSDNLTITRQKATVDSIEYAISNDAIQADRLDAGTHEIVWYVEDENSNVFTITQILTVQDVTPPNIEVVLSEKELNLVGSIEAIISTTDKYGIKSILASFDDIPVDVTNNKVILDNLTAGNHYLTITAVDNNDNIGTYTREIVVYAGDITPPDLDVDISVEDYRRINIIAYAIDDSGDAVISGTVNGKNLIFNNGAAFYDPEGIGEFEIVVRAEDASGNYTEKTQTVIISEQIPEYELKLSAVPDKNTVKPNEAVDISVRTNALVSDVTISCTADGGKITETNSGYNFVSENEGTFKVVITATTENGSSANETIYITVSNDEQEVDDNDGEGEYENTYTPEPRARVVLKSTEKTETKMTEEMADLADHLKTPLAVYEYLYNNINVEFYTGSRKGAIGTYEQNGGNDVDSASLLIAMLRYLGYDAEYVTGTVGYTEKQILDITAADNIDTALKILTLGNRAVNRSGNIYYFDHTWVKSDIEGTDYYLDIGFKKYRQIDSIADEVEKQSFDIDTDVIGSPVNAYIYLAQFNDSDEQKSINVTGKSIVKKKISTLPQETSYIIEETKEERRNIVESSLIETDTLYLGFKGKYQKSISAPDSYISSISIGYVPNNSLYRGYGISKPTNIYNLDGDYLATYTNSISPALFVDNVNVYEWNNALTKLGQLQTLSIGIKSNGSIYEDTKEILVGSVNVIVTDTQAISAQSIYTAYEAMPLTDDEKAKVNENNVFNDKYIGNLLNLIGNTYFMQLDLENKLLAGAKKIYTERTFSYGIFTYNPTVTTLYSQVKLEKSGSYGVDIIGNICSTVSYNDNSDDEKNFRFASGYVSSYLESLILEQFLGVYSISTAKIFELASSNGISFKVIASQNEEEIDLLPINNESKTDIHKAVADGKKVIIPAERISIGGWSGTGYIIVGNGEYSFMISNGSHGGYSVGNLSVYFSINVVLAGDALFHVLKDLLTASVVMFMTGNFIGGVVFLALTITLTYLLLDYVSNCLDLYLAALSGNADAANRLNLNAFLSTIGFLAQPLIEPIAAGLSRVKAPKCITNVINAGNDWILANSEAYRRFVMMGYSDEVVSGLFADSRCFLYGDDFIEGVLASGDAHGIMETLAKCPDEIVGAISESTVKDTLPSFFSNYGDDGAKMFYYCGDNIVNSTSNLSDDVADHFIQTLSNQNDSFYSYLISQGDDFINDISQSYEADMIKLNNWTQSPEYGSYIQNKVVYDDSRYFDQITGDAIYPPQDGFLNGVIPEPTVVPEGTYFLRYGNSSGSFLGGVTDTFESRSLPPFTDTNNYHYYRLSEDCEFSVGKIEPWFGQKGLGDQYVIYAYDEYGNILKDSSGNYIRYSVDYMLNNNILEDITENVMKGEIIIE